MLIMIPLIKIFVLFQNVETLLCFFVIDLIFIFNLNCISYGRLLGTIMKETRLCMYCPLTP
jgi:hypothetical protein